MVRLPLTLVKKCNYSYFMEHLRRFVQTISQMSDADFELIVPILDTMRVRKKENLLSEGDICKHVYFLRSGFFRLFYVDFNGNEINCRFVGEHRFFVDFSSFLTQTPSKYYWQAVQDSELYMLKYSDIQAIYQRSPAWDHFGRLMAEYVYREMSERTEMLLFLKPEERYQYLLKKSPELFNQVSQFHIASYLGVKPESLSRLRKRLLKR